MTKKSTLLVFLFLFAAGFSFAQSTSPDSSQVSQPSAASQKVEISGTIDKIDLDGKSITIKDEAGNTTKVYTFTDATVFTKDDAPFTVDTLKVGDRVMVETDAANSIVTLKIHTVPATPEPPEKDDDKQDQKQEKDKE